MNLITASIFTGPGHIMGINFKREVAMIHRINWRKLMITREVVKSEIDLVEELQVLSLMP
jgi:hypothetical protein